VREVVFAGSRYGSQPSFVGFALLYSSRVATINHWKTSAEPFPFAIAWALAIELGTQRDRTRGAERGSEREWEWVQNPSFGTEFSLPYRVQSDRLQG